jgi:hypothetical protein
MVDVSEASRALRASTPAAETLDSARASSQWNTKKAWGEQKGATMEAGKAVERAQRDAVKAAVPEAADLLKTQSQAIPAKNVLDRMAQRTANRDALSLPGLVGAAPAVAAGKVPLLGLAAQWLRNNQMKAGIYAKDLEDAINRQDVQAVGYILERLGVGSGAQLAPGQ